MKFSYSKKRLYFNLILGILWTGIGTSYFFENEKIRWNVNLTLIRGIVYIAKFLYEYTQKYVEITKDKIRINSIPSKEISLNDVKEVNYYANDYTIKTTNKTFKIVKSQINKAQLPEFENFLNNINIELKKNII